jgi:ParB-like chromosome segregation protein Spo0J
MTKATIPTNPWQNRIVGHDTVDPNTLLKNPANWRTHPKNQREALGAVLDKVGWVQDAIVNQRSGFVIDGHLRIDLAIARSEKVPVVYVDLSPEEEALILASIDPLSAMAVPDSEKLTALLSQFSVEPGALADLLGLGPKPSEGLTDPDECPAVQEAVVTQLGDLWLLGAYVECPHCGERNDV